MYSVIVADDEAELREAMIRNIDWHAIGFEVAGRAENGVEALELCEKLEPDLLITDIKMPFIAGIELARRIREIRPAMHIAFLSGYDNFTYAQQAISYNIISYLLKPLSAGELTGELIKIKNKMDSINEAFKNAGEADAEEISLERFLMSLLLYNAGAEFRGEYEKEALKYHFKRSEDDNPSYTVLISCLENSSGKNITNGQHVSSINSILKKYLRCGSFYSGGRVVSLVAGTLRELKKYTGIAANEIVQTAGRVLNAGCYIGISRPTDNIASLKISFEEAVLATEYFRADKKIKIRFIDDLEKNGSLTLEYMEDAISCISHLLKAGTEEEIRSYLKNLFEDFIKMNISKSDIDLLLMQMLAAGCQVIKNVSDSRAAEDFLVTIPIVGNIFSSRSINNAKEEFTDFCLSAKSFINEQRRVKNEILCDSVQDIIDKQYADESLSLTALSNMLHFSPNYLSALIKKTLGETFINLLTERRMKAAKEYVLYSPLRILDIAFKCGYSDQRYFSYCFKKRYGMSPNKMRELGAGEGDK